MNTDAEYDDDDDPLRQQAEQLVLEAESWHAQSAKNWMGIKCEGEDYVMKEPKTRWLPPYRAPAPSRVVDVKPDSHDQSPSGSLATSDQGEMLLDALNSQAWLAGPRMNQRASQCMYELHEPTTGVSSRYDLQDPEEIRLVAARAALQVQASGPYGPCRPPTCAIM